MKLLALIPELSLLDEIVSRLQKEGYSCEGTSDYNEGLERLSLYEYDCVVVKTNISETSLGQLLEVFSDAYASVGIIVLSDTSAIDERIKVLNAGADDFLSTPVHSGELAARINAIVRRKRFQTKNKLYFGNLVVNFQEKNVKVWDKDLHLTKKEYEMLLYFLANKDRVVSKTTLAEYLWGDATDNMDSFNLLFAHIKNLRKKLGQFGAELEIKNVYGMGYQIIEI